MELWFYVTRHFKLSSKLKHGRILLDRFKGLGYVCERCETPIDKKLPPRVRCYSRVVFYEFSGTKAALPSDLEAMKQAFSNSIKSITHDKTTPKEDVIELGFACLHIFLRDVPFVSLHFIVF